VGRRLDGDMSGIAGRSSTLEIGSFHRKNHLDLGLGGSGKSYWIAWFAQCECQSVISPLDNLSCTSLSFERDSISSDISGDAALPHIRWLPAAVQHILERGLNRQFALEQNQSRPGTVHGIEDKPPFWCQGLTQYSTGSRLSSVESIATIVSTRSRTHPWNKSYEDGA